MYRNPLILTSHSTALRAVEPGGGRAVPDSIVFTTKRKIKVSRSSVTFQSADRASAEQ